MATVTSVGSGNYNTGSTWDSGARPGSSDDVVIASGHTVTLVQAENANSLDLQSGGTLDGNNNVLTIDGENSSGYAVNLDGAISGSDTDITITTAATTAVDFNPTSGAVRDLTINNGGNTITLTDPMTLSRNLTITAGELDTASDRALTVTGHVSVDGTLTGNASAISVGSMIINSGGTYNATSGTTTVTSENASHAFRCSGGGTFTNNDGTLEIQTAAQTRLKMNGTGNVHNLTVNHASCQLHMESDSSTTVEGDLTITAGIVNTNTEGGASRNLTVTGFTDVTGTLTLNDSTVSVGGLRTNSGAALTLGSSGTLEITAASNFGGTEGANYSWRNTDGTSDINIGGTLTVSGAGYFEPRTAPDHASVLNNLVWNTIYYWVGKLTIGGTLVVNASKKMETYNGSKDSIVNGDVTLNGELKALGNNVSAMEFGSLTINSGGTYNATSGTTTITSRTGGTGTYALENNGTFTHNNGTVAITDSDNVVSMKLGSSLYNLTLSGGTKKIRDNTTINNDLTVTSGDLYSHSSTLTLTVTGDATISNGGSIGSTLAFTSDISFGSLTIESGGTYSATSGTTTLTSGGANGDNAASLYGAGTFTHNKGTLHFASGAQYRIPVGGTFYNVTADVSIYGYDGVLLPQPTMPDGTTANDFISIEGTLRINNNAVNPYNSDGFYVHNLIIGDGTGSANSAKFDLSSSDVFNGNVYVDNVTINSDGQFLFGDGDEPQSSTLNVYGAFRNLGGSVDIA